MSDDFEKCWLAKLAGALAEVTDAPVRGSVMEGSEQLSADSPHEEVIAWSRGAMARLDALLDEEMRKEVMTRCACHYPAENLAEIRAMYAATGDISKAHQMLQARFEAFLRGPLNLDEESIAQIVQCGWGLAGMLRGDRIIATKIPKSGNLAAYLAEDSPQEQRKLYCHCPRIAEVLGEAEPLSITYCYCGAGYYRNIWETILDKPVDIEILASVLRGDRVCSFAIHLPKAERSS